MIIRRRWAWWKKEVVEAGDGGGQERVALRMWGMFEEKTQEDADFLSRGGCWNERGDGVHQMLRFGSQIHPITPFVIFAHMHSSQVWRPKIQISVIRKRAARNTAQH